MRLLRRHAFEPPPINRRPLTWWQFLSQYKDFMLATDFVTVATARLRTFQVMFFKELRRRRLLRANLTEYPHAEWVVDQLRNLAVQHDPFPKFTLHDCDGWFSEKFDTLAETVDAASERDQKKSKRVHRDTHRAGVTSRSPL